MKALSIKQPWLHCITELDKRVENRSWKPPQWMIGEKIALHASKGLASKESIGVASKISGVNLSVVNSVRGAIVATAVVEGWLWHLHLNSMTETERKWFAGPFGWVLTEVKKLETPVICRGHLGLWGIPQEVEEKMFPGGQMSLSLEWDGL